MTGSFALGTGPAIPTSRLRTLSSKSMKTVKVYQYRVRDPITGRRYLTRYKLTEEEAAERYPKG